jgi:uncharacterized protein (DUF2267 family)
MDAEQFFTAVQRVAEADRATAGRATRATLETLAERISKEEALQAAAELPAEIAPYLHTAGPAEKFDVDEFLSRVASREQVDVPTAERHVRGVFSAFAQAVSPKEYDDVTGLLPKDFTYLLPRGTDVEIVPAKVLLDKVAERLGVDTETARRTTEAVLQTLAERLARGELEDLAARLPAELRELVRATAAAAPPGGRQMSLDRFLERIAEREGIDPLVEARKHARAVLTTLREAVEDDEFFDITVQLPPEYRPLWTRG